MMKEIDESDETVYCTVVARNYLPQALALQESVARVEPGRQLKIMIVDGALPSTVKPRIDCEFVGLEALELPDGDADTLAAIYDVVELSTAVKPRFLRQLLRRYRRAVYLDPDMQVITPLEELAPLIDEHCVVLTPHILEPIPPGETYRSEINTLTVGVHNLGFCAVGRGAEPYLDWWWSHLQRECLIYPLLGLFVDQKWTDIGAVMFEAHSLRHRGYNIGHWNLHERHIVRDATGYSVGADEHPLRLLHFSGFDPRSPEAISVRQNIDLADTGIGSAAYLELARAYAAILLEAEAELGSKPAYGYQRDSSGKRLTTRLRRGYRSELTDPARQNPPSAFDPADRAAFRRWKRQAVFRIMGTGAADAALAFKYAFPDTFKAIKRGLPGISSTLRTRLLESSRVRR